MKIFLQEFGDVLGEISSVPGNLIIAGDFNIHVDNSKREGVTEFAQILDQHELEQNVVGVTHKRGHTLDLVITRQGEDTVRDVHIVNRHISDHYLIDFNIFSCHHLSRNMDGEIFRRNFRDIDISTLKNYLMVNINKETDSDADTIIESYMNAVETTLDELCPKKRRKLKKKEGTKPWYTDNIHGMRKLLRHNEKMWRNSGLEIHRHIFTDHRNNLTKEITQAKIEYYKEKLTGADQGTAFKVMSNILSTSGDNLPDDPPDGALSDQFAVFFDEKITKIRKAIDSVTPQLDITTPTTVQKAALSSLTEASVEEVSKIIMSCKPKSCALDSLPTDILKLTLPVHLDTITKLVNTSFSTGVFPSALKRAVVSPILKKAGCDRDCLQNYRPVSNLPFVSKVVEKIAAKRLIEHLDNNQLQEEFQSAYRAKHSTETALMKVRNDITMAIDTGQSAMLVLLDLSAAFDTVEVDTLIHTLQDHFGVTGSALDWFRSYVIDRYFQVKVKGTSSKWIKLQYGVPQGSVLGPLLFSLYAAPIEAILRKHKVRYHKFADDLQIYVFFDPSKPGDRERAISQIKKCIAEVSAWMLINKLKLNPSKTEYILVQSKHNLAKYGEFCIKVGDADVKPSASVRNLGVFMDRGNTCESQVNALCKKCTFHLRRIGSIRRFLPRDVLQGIVTALVLSNLDYCNALLSGITANQL